MNRSSTAASTFKLAAKKVVIQKQVSVAKGRLDEIQRSRSERGRALTKQQTEGVHHDEALEKSPMQRTLNCIDALIKRVAMRAGKKKNIARATRLPILLLAGLQFPILLLAINGENAERQVFWLWTFQLVTFPCMLMCAVSLFISFEQPTWSNVAHDVLVTILPAASYYTQAAASFAGWLPPITGLAGGAMDGGWQAAVEACFYGTMSLASGLFVLKCKNAMRDGKWITRQQRIRHSVEVVFLKAFVSGGNTLLYTVGDLVTMRDPVTMLGMTRLKGLRLLVPHLLMGLTCGAALFLFGTRAENEPISGLQESMFKAIIFTWAFLFMREAGFRRWRTLERDAFQTQKFVNHEGGTGQGCVPARTGQEQEGTNIFVETEKESNKMFHPPENTEGLGELGQMTNYIL
ncbi:hypothetical protein TeGR_g2695 [Tetraparma gracilis]|uniref:Transmembrane protein n=1 Tax=Tetraparma gracilis TaxID=2962635 RepID=A0ABQ6M875_9STRA|nr:hypothetical protein TeGR_g2695 [Tetraparma gracilis]